MAVLNNDMNPKTDKLDQDQMKQDQSTVEEKRPDDVGGFYVQAGIKIFDPETKQVFVEKRA